MDYEKKYNEALSQARFYHGNCPTEPEKKKLEKLFPELRESEDERIRKAIRLVLIATEDEQKDFYSTHGLTRKDCTNWLEKQKEQKPERINITEMVAKYEVTDEYVEGEYKGKPVNCMIRAYEQGIRDTLLKVKEQKPAEWSEEDETALGDLLWCIEQARHSAKDENDMGNIWYAEKWLKERLKSIRPQPKQEWNEYDNEMFHCICAGLCHLRKLYEKNEDAVSDYNAMIEWFRNCFKSLRPSWKPSEEQMSMLLAVINEPNNSGAESCQIALRGIYEQLKKL